MKADRSPVGSLCPCVSFKSLLMSVCILVDRIVSFLVCHSVFLVYMFLDIE